MPPNSELPYSLPLAVVASCALHILLLVIPLLPTGKPMPPSRPVSLRLTATINPAKPTSIADLSPIPAVVGTTPGASEEVKTEGAISPEPPWKITSEMALPYLPSRDVDIPAEPIDKPLLVLPVEILQERIHGKVELRVYIGSNGHIDAVEVVSSSHPGLLEDAARQAISDTRFAPAMKGGFPVRTVKRIEVLFDPDEEEEPPQTSNGKPGEVTPVPAAAGS